MFLLLGRSVDILRIFRQDAADTKAQITIMVFVDFGRNGGVLVIEMPVAGQTSFTAIHHIIMKYSVPERAFGE